MKRICSLARSGSVLVSATLFVGYLTQLGIAQSPQNISNSPLTIRHERDFATPLWGHMPTISAAGLLLRAEHYPSDSPLIELDDRSGRHEQILFDIPRSNDIMIHWVAGGSDGSIVVAGFAHGNDSKGTAFLGWIAPDRAHRTLIQTSPFIPSIAVVSADGVIWGIGRKSLGPGPDHVAWNVVERYTSSGKLLSSLTVDGARARPETPNAADASWLVASMDRVGWMTNGGQYIEFKLDGTEIGRYDAPAANSKRYHGVALSADDELIVGQPTANGTAVFQLDRPSKGWLPVSIPDHEQGKGLDILGFDGNVLVASQGNATVQRYTVQRFSPSAHK